MEIILTYVYIDNNSMNLLINAFILNINRIGCTLVYKHIR